MAVESRKLKADDLRTLLQRKGRSYVESVSEDEAKYLECAPHSISVFMDEKLVMCAGVVPYWKNRGEAWAVLEPTFNLKSAGYSNLKDVQACVKRELDGVPMNRIEAAVACDFAPGHRWLRSLGFELDAKRLRQFLPDGKDAALYSRLRKEVSGG